jgi:hypothetical protein
LKLERGLNLYFQTQRVFGLIAAGERVLVCCTVVGFLSVLFVIIAVMFIEDAAAICCSPHFASCLRGRYIEHSLDMSDEPYLIRAVDLNSIRVCLRRHAGPQATFQAYFHALCLRRCILDPKLSISTNQSLADMETTLLDASYATTRRLCQAFLTELAIAGWDTNQINIEDGAWRCEWDEAL